MNNAHITTRPIPPLTSALLERFVSKVEFTDSCWFWSGSQNSEGYGIYRCNGTSYRAHRVSFVWFVGQMPPPLITDHLCRVHSCVNPDHLEPVTHVENTLRGESFSAKNKNKTHCSRGHPFTPENTLFNTRETWRRCLICAHRRQGSCPICGRRERVRNDGTLIKHTTLRYGSVTCEGSYRKQTTADTKSPVAAKDV